MKRVINVGLLVFMTVYLLLGCTLEAQSNRIVSRTRVKSIVQEAVNSELDSVLPILDEKNPGFSRSLTSRDSEEIVSRSIGEENGEEYLDFTYSVLTSNNTRNVLSQAKGLIPEAEYEELFDSIEEEELNAKKIFEAKAKYLTREEQIEFYDDLQTLVVKSSVLLTAAVVYAFMPKVLLWGKVTAACGISVAAGIVAGGIMSFVGYYNLDAEIDETFADWMQTIFEDSYASWAIGAAMLATASSMTTSVVAQAIVLGSFALFGVFKEAGPLLKKYNIKK